MSAYSDCKTCGATCVNVHHQCPPKWLVLDKDYSGDDWEDAYTVYERDADEAACKAAELMDNGGDGPSERRVLCRLAPDGEIVGPFDISFEYSVDYYASRVTAGKTVTPEGK